MQIKQRRDTRHKFNVKTKKSRHEEISLHDDADAGRADHIGDAQASLAPHSLARGFTYPDGYRETETFADIVEMARLYILTDCGGSFETFSEWGLIRPKAQE